MHAIGLCRNFDGTEPPNTPRSVAACRAAGLDPSQLCLSPSALPPPPNDGGGKFDALRATYAGRLREKFLRDATAAYEKFRDAPAHRHASAPTAAVGGTTAEEMVEREEGVPKFFHSLKRTAAEAKRRREAYEEKMERVAVGLAEKRRRRDERLADASAKADARLEAVLVAHAAHEKERIDKVMAKNNALHRKIEKAAVAAADYRKREAYSIDAVTAAAAERQEARRQQMLEKQKQAEARAERRKRDLQLQRELEEYEASLIYACHIAQHERVKARDAVRREELEREAQEDREAAARRRQKHEELQAARIKFRDVISQQRLAVARIFAETTPTDAAEIEPPPWLAGRMPQKGATSSETVVSSTSNASLYAGGRPPLNPKVVVAKWMCD